MKTTSWVDRILGGLDRVLQIVCIILLGLVAFAVAAQVVARYVTSASTPWTVELASYSFVWLSMFAIALGIRRGRHMVLDIWEYVPSRRWLTVLIDTIAAITVVAVLALLIWFGIETLAPAFRRTMPGLGLPYGLVSLAIPVGSAFALIFAVEAWWRTLHAKNGEDPLQFGVLYQPEDTVVIKGEI